MSIFSSVVASISSVYLGLSSELDCVMCEQCVPYLICMSSDTDVNIRLKADQQLLEIDKKYTGFIQVTVRLLN